MVGRALIVAVAALAVAAPARAALAPGDAATVDVSVATLWTAPGLARSIDAPALSNPADPAAWSRNLATTASRIWLDGKVVTQALYGEAVTVLAVRGGWAKVVVPDQPTPLDRRGYPGWVPVRQVAAGVAAGAPAQQVVVLAPTATLTLASGRTLTVSYGTRLPVAGRSGGVVSVTTPDGAGTLPAASVGPAQPATGAAIVSAVRPFLGVRYLWGGLSAWGFDCSGLVWDVFRAHGVVVPRDADAQARGGTPVSPLRLRPGDLVFYGTPVVHVAIYAGGGRMLEAPDSAHRVRLVPLRPGVVAVRRYTSS